MQFLQTYGKRVVTHANLPISADQVDALWDADIVLVQLYKYTCLPNLQYVALMGKFDWSTEIKTGDSALGNENLG